MPNVSAYRLFKVVVVSCAPVINLLEPELQNDLSVNPLLGFL